MKQVTALVLFLTVLLSACGQVRETQGTDHTDNETPVDSISHGARPYVVAEGLLRFAVPANVINQSDAPRFSLDPELQAERDVFLGEEVVLSIRVVPRSALILEAPHSRPMLINAILESGGPLTDRNVWDAIEQSPFQPGLVSSSFFLDSIAPVQECSAMIG